MEQSGIGQEMRGSRRARQGNRGRTNDGTERQVLADELAWRRHHHTRGPLGMCEVEIGKHQAIAAVHRGSVACLVIPDFEVRHFTAFDARDDSEREAAAALEAERVVKAGAALLDHRKVERRGIGDGLNLVGSIEALILNRDRRTIHDVHHLLERVAEVWIAGTAVAQIPTGVHVEVHQIRQPRCLQRCHGTAWQRAEEFEIHRPRRQRRHVKRRRLGNNFDQLAFT